MTVNLRPSAFTRRVTVVLVCGVSFLAASFCVVVGSVCGGTTVMPHSIGQVFNEFRLPITPSGDVFGPVVMVILYQATWLVFGAVLDVKKREQLLPSCCYVSFAFACCLIVMWSMLVTREWLTGATIVMFAALLVVGQTAFLVTASVEASLTSHSMPNTRSLDCRFVWYTRFLVANGLLHLAAWLLMAAVLQAGIALCYRGDASARTSSTVAFTTLIGVAFVWFVLENTILSTRLRFVCSEYLAFFIGTQSFRRHGEQSREGILADLAMVYFAILLLVRLMVIFYSERYRSLRDSYLQVHETNGKEAAAQADAKA